MFAIDVCPPHWIVHCDDSIVVGNKPAAMSLEKQDTALGFAERLRLGVERRIGHAVTLYPQAHLERDTSGLVLFAATKQAHATLQAPRDKSELQTTYAGVVDGVRGRVGGQHSASVIKDRQGVVRPSQGRSATRVTLAVRELHTQGRRSLVELRSNHLGSRGARAVLLGACGLHVVGDNTLGGPTSYRLMMHATALSMRHPGTGEDWSVRIDPPRALLSLVDPLLPVASVIEEAMLEGCAKRFELMERGHRAIRLFHGEGEGFPGVDLDLYDDHFVLWLAEQLDASTRSSLIASVARMGSQGVYLKVRPKQASRLTAEQKRAHAPDQCVAGNSASDDVIVQEGPLRLLTRLHEGLATGLYLDQRGNRAWIQTLAKGQSVLNLFAYTCSFTVAAARAGARCTVSVDAAARALETGRRNLELNGLSGAAHELVCDDVFLWMKRAIQGQRRFDIIVLDPPSFATTRTSKLTLERDLRGLVADCLRLVSEGGGRLLVCTNHRGIGWREFTKRVQEAAKDAGRSICGMHQMPAEQDFPWNQGDPHMKSMVVQVGDIRC